jgi:hypothetical protein
MSSVDFRCPNSPRRLFARLEVPPDVVATEGFELSVACLDCRRAAREHNRPATLVLHWFDLAGRHLRTQVLPILPTTTPEPDLPASAPSDGM